MRFRPVLAAVALACVAVPALAHIVSDREVTLLRQLPPRLVAGLTRDDAPDATGATPGNRPESRDLAGQRGAFLRLDDAAARADSATAEITWRAIDATFAHQTPAGDFQPDAHDRAVPDTSLAHLGGIVAGIAELARSEVIVLNSPLADRFRFRVALMLPKLRRTIDALAARAATLARLHRSRPDLRIVDAEAFLLADGIYHEPSLNQLGVAALAEALAAQRPDGAFGRDDALDAQALATWSLLAITTYYPAPSLEQAARRASDGLAKRLERLPRTATRVHPAGVRDGLIAIAYEADLAADAGRHERAARLAHRWGY